MSQQNATETAWNPRRSYYLGPRPPFMARAYPGQSKMVILTQRKPSPITSQSTNHPKTDHFLHIGTKTPTVLSQSQLSSKLSQPQPPKPVSNPCKDMASVLVQHSNTSYEESLSR